MSEVDGSRGKKKEEEKRKKNEEEEEKWNCESDVVDNQFHR